MLNMDTMRAIGMMVARQAREKATLDTTTANEVIDMTALLEPWKAGTMEAPVEYPADAIRTHNGAPWRCTMARTHHGETGWAPGEGNAMWTQKHGTDRAHALPWSAPAGAHDAYNVGEWMIYTDGIAYKCKQDATVWGPDTLPAAWEAAE